MYLSTYFCFVSHYTSIRKRVSIWLRDKTHWDRRILFYFAVTTLLVILFFFFETRLASYLHTLLYAAATRSISTLFSDSNPFVLPFIFLTSFIFSSSLLRSRNTAVSASSTPRAHSARTYERFWFKKQIKRISRTIRRGLCESGRARFTYSPGALLFFSVYTDVGNKKPLRVFAE